MGTNDELAWRMDIWRDLPVTPDYAEAKLGLKHGGGESNE